MSQPEGNHRSVDAVLQKGYNDAAALLQVLELVLGALVRCPQKEKFISTILGLGQAVQEDLMVLIQKTLRESSLPDEASSPPPLDSEPRKLQLLLDDVRERLAEAQQANQVLESENHWLQERVQELEHNVADHSQLVHSNSAIALAELEGQVKAKDFKLQELHTQIAELKKLIKEQVHREINKKQRNGEEMKEASL